MRRWLCVLLFLLLASAPVFGADGEPLPMLDVLRIVHRDLANMSPESRKYARYLDFHYEPNKKVRDRRARTLFGHLNGLSRESDITRPVVLDGDGWVMRFDGRDYGAVFQKTYERLDNPDPYYHVKVESETYDTYEYPGGRGSDGKYYEKGTYKRNVKKVVKSAVGPILSDGKVEALLITEIVNWTRSSVFLVSAEWFFNQTAADQDRDPGYYEFIGVKTESDFQKVVGFDAKAVADFGLTELRGAVAESPVTLQARALRRDASLDGAYWRSFDFQKAVDKQNPLRVLGADIERQFDASEQFGMGPNGFWKTGIFKLDRTTQFAAPGQIATDHTSKSNDHQVHNYISCLRCHSNGGLQDIDEWARVVFNGPPLLLQSPDYDVQKKLRQQYLRRLEPFLKRDRDRYEAAVKEATGWTSKEYSAALAEMWEEYEDANVDLAWMAARLSVKPAHFRAALVQYVQRTGNLDIVLAAFVKGKSIKIRQAEEVFQLAYLALRGYVAP